LDVEDVKIFRAKRRGRGRGPKANENEILNTRS
jgi:hypothetical protein